MKLTKIYIGSNNATGELELAKILDIMATSQSGYTLTQGQGFYEGKSENVAIIEIYGDYNTGIIPQLKQTLAQKSILVAESIVSTNFHD